jgi:hypothetical protein
VEKEIFARYAELAAAYPHDGSEMVSSHNDVFKPDNILFDGQSVWLVDWEAAFLNDRYADLAAIANQIVTNDEEELGYLQGYFGAAPNAYQLARFHLMQQISPLFYTMGFLLLGSSGKPIDWSPGGRPAGQRREDRLRPGSLGTAFAQCGATTVQRSAQDCFVGRPDHDLIRRERE